MSSLLSEQQFITKLGIVTAKVHLVGQYVNTSIKTTFGCNNGHVWDATPRNVLYNGAGCPHCSKKAKKTTAVFLAELAQLNSVRPIQVNLVPGQSYKSSFSSMLFECNNGHIWTNTPSNIINSEQTCKACTGYLKKTTLGFIKELSAIRNDVWVVSGQEYRTSQTKLQFKCVAAHVWTARPIDILLGTGCPDCVNKGYSTKAINWLSDIAKSTGLNIRHALNGGEFRIPGTKFYADGFCEDTNTIYEFYGDAFHGNPEMFHATDNCHPFDKRIKAGTLFTKTKQREQLLVGLGYNIVTIWETDYNATNR